MAPRIQFDHPEFHGRQWRAVFRAPLHLQETIGKTVFKKGLGTDSRSKAEVRARTFLHECKTIVKEAQRKAKAAPLAPIAASALEDLSVVECFETVCGVIERRLSAHLV